MTSSAPAVPETSALLRVRQARLFLFISTLFWGLSLPVMRGLELAQKQLVPDISDLTLTSLDSIARFGLATLLLALYQSPRLWSNFHRLTRLELSQGIGLGLLASGGMYGQCLGLNSTDASVAAFLTQLYSLLVPLFVAVRDRTWPRPFVWIACALVLAGIGLLSPHFLAEARFSSGEIAIGIGAIFFAAQILWLERPRYAANNLERVTLLMFGTMTTVFLLFALCTTAHLPPVLSLFASPAILILLLTIVFFCTLANFYIMNLWQVYVTATEASMIYCLEPVIAALLATFLPGLISDWTGIAYPNEQLGRSFFLGAALILAATILVALCSGVKEKI